MYLGVLARTDPHTRVSTCSASTSTPTTPLHVPPNCQTRVWRRIRMVIVRIVRAGCRINPRSQRWASRRDRQLSGGSCVEPEGYQLATSKIHVFLQENAGCFRRRRLPEVYRWFSVRKVLGEEPFVGGRYRAQLVRHQTE